VVAFTPVMGYLMSMVNTVFFGLNEEEIAKGRAKETQLRYGLFQGKGKPEMVGTYAAQLVSILSFNQLTNDQYQTARYRNFRSARRDLGVIGKVSGCWRDQE
jgi:hypothetical protein